MCKINIQFYFMQMYIKKPKSQEKSALYLNNIYNNFTQTVLINVYTTRVFINFVDKFINQ